MSNGRVYVPFGGRYGDCGNYHGRVVSVAVTAAGLGSTASYIEGMDREEGRALLAELLDWATQPRFVYRHRWTLGDLLIWDNTGTMHRAQPYTKESGRLMHRTTLAGKELIA